MKKISEKDNDFVLGVLVDFLKGVGELVDNALETVGAVKVEYDPDKLSWVEAEGGKGPYQRCNDVDKPDFDGLARDLEAHKGTLTRDGWFYWLFDTGDAVGRKRAKTKK